MSFKDDLAKARESRPEPVRQQIALGDALYEVEIMRLDGLDWAAITSECPPTDEKGARLGYDTNKAALLACRRHSRLLDDEGEPVDMTVVRDDDGRVVADPWRDLFTEISGTEVSAIAATWWAMNIRDPNQRVVGLKKASRAGR